MVVPMAIKRDQRCLLIEIVEKEKKLSMTSNFKYVARENHKSQRKQLNTSNENLNK